MHGPFRGLWDGTVWYPPWYPDPGFSIASSAVKGHQSASEYVCSGQSPLERSNMDPKEDVMTYIISEHISPQFSRVFSSRLRTMRFTWLPWLTMAFRMPVVPLIAGSRRSLFMSVALK